MPSSQQKKSYSVSVLKAPPFVGMLRPLVKDPLGFTVEASRQYGDIISFKVMGRKFVQLNHPDLIRYVLIENHKNYKKSSAYIRFESAGGKGLLTSHGEKWKRDRQKIQPFFNRELIAGYHFEIANEVGEKYKQKWLSLTGNGPVEINITLEMANITIETMMKVIFGRDLDDETIAKLHHSYDVVIDYLKGIRLFPSVDLRKVLRRPSYFTFQKALDYIYEVIKSLATQYRNGQIIDRRNMFALLLDAQKNDPDHFTDNEIRDHCIVMIFAGFETTSVSMQWMWYALDGRQDIKDKLDHDIVTAAPSTALPDSSELTFESLGKMDYLTAFFKETLRLYPAFWVTAREPIEDDHLGDFKVEKGTAVTLPQYAMHLHPAWWEKPNEFIPERFLPLNTVRFDEGIYFPFAHGPRKCIGSLFAEMEAKTIMAKLLPLFDVAALNKQDNAFYPSIALKLKQPLMARISRRRSFN